MSDLPVFGATFREVRGRTRDGNATRVVRASRTYPTELDDLWEAITMPERLARWFSPVSGELRLGGSYQVEGNAGGTIEQCQPPEKLALSWEFGDNVSWLSVNLQGVDQGSQLILEHEMATDSASEEHWDKYGPGATGVGWDLALVGLQWHTDKTDSQHGKRADDAWALSEAGVEFIRASTTAWQNADQEAGQVVEIARRRCEATYKFYTGT